MTMLSTKIYSTFLYIFSKPNKNTLIRHVLAGELSFER